MIRQSKEIPVFLAILTLLTAGVGGLQAQDLHGELVRVYRGWVSANVNKDYRAWKRYTASHRVAITHNMVVSRKDDWPGVIFSLPFRAPEISTLRLLATLQDGPTAHMIYYGKIDFGILEGEEIPNNMLVLRFVQEEEGWKFDNTRFFNLSGDAAAQHMAEKGDLSLLSDDRFRPNGAVPPTPEMLKEPDYVGEVWIASIGYETTVRIGDAHESNVRDNVITDLIIGGLSRDGKAVEIQASKTEVPEDVKPRLEVEIYALRPGKKAHRVWFWKPTPEAAPEGTSSKVWANAVTIPGG